MPNKEQKSIADLIYEKLYQNRVAFLKNYNDSKKLIFKKYFEKRYTLQDDEKIIKKKLNVRSDKITNNFEIIYQSKIFCPSTLDKLGVFP